MINKFYNTKEFYKIFDEFDSQTEFEYEDGLFLLISKIELYTKDKLKQFEEFNKFGYFGIDFFTNQIMLKFFKSGKIKTNKPKDYVYFTYKFRDIHDNKTGDSLEISLDVLKDVLKSYASSFKNIKLTEDIVSNIEKENNNWNTFGDYTDFLENNFKDNFFLFGHIDDCVSDLGSLKKGYNTNIDSIITCLLKYI